MARKSDVRFIPGEGGQSIAPEAVIRQEVSRVTGGKVPVTSGRGGRVIVGGGSGSPARPLPQSTLETPTESAEVVTAKREAKKTVQQLRKERAVRIQESQSIKERTRVVKGFERKLFLAKVREKVRAVKAGRIKSFSVGTSKGRVKITKQNVQQFEEQPKQVQKTETRKVTVIRPKEFGGRDVQPVQRANIKKQKLGTYAELKIRELLDIPSRAVLKRIPSGSPVKKVLETRVPGFRFTDVAKFSFFTPAMATTPETIATGVARGGLKPIPQTTFKANIIPKGKGFQTTVISKTEIGGKTVTGFSRQAIKDIDKTVSVGAGRTAILSRKVPTQIKGTRADVGGITKRLGKAKFVQKRGPIEKVDDVGIGVASRTISKVTREDILTTGARLGFPRRLTRKIKGKVEQEKLTGVLLKTKDPSKFGFVGTTRTPVTRISKTGITQRIRDPEITGVLKIGRGTKETTGKVIIPSTVQRTSLQQITQTLPTVQQQAQRQVVRSVSKVPKLPKTPTTITTLSKQESLKAVPSSVFSRQVVSQAQVQLQTTKQSALPSISLASATSQAQKQRQRVLTKQDTKLDQALSSTQSFKLKQSQIQRQRQLLRLKVISKTQQTPKIPLVYRGISKSTLAFPKFSTRIGSPERKTKRRKRTSSFDKLFLTPGLTGIAIGKKRFIKEKDILKEALKPMGVGIRGIPIIIKNNGKKRK